MTDEYKTCPVCLDMIEDTADELCGDCSALSTADQLLAVEMRATDAMFEAFCRGGVPNDFSIVPATKHHAKVRGRLYQRFVERMEVKDD